jgi:hypothetical protein
MNLRLTQTAVLVAQAVACLALVGCGGADNSQTSQMQAGVAAAPGATASEAAASSVDKAVVSQATSAPAPSAIANLQPGQWLELPNTKIRSVLPNPQPQGYAPYIVEAWNGGTADTARNRLLVFGGGHSDYWGNEIYALDLPTMSIKRIVEPSAQTSSANCTPSLPDGSPTSRHTYDGLAYVAHLDKFFATNGSLAPCGWGGKDTWTYDFATSRWQLHTTSAPTDLYGTMAVYDPATKLVYVKDTQDFYSYSVENNRYTKLNSSLQSVDYHLSATLDTKRRKFVMIGDGVQVVDLATGTMTRMATTNAPSLVTSQQSPGVAYDPVADRVVAWHGGRNVYALNMDTGVWSQVATNAGPTSAAPNQGTFGRFEYFPQYGVFALINSIDENAWVFRLAN